MPNPPTGSDVRPYSDCEMFGTMRDLKTDVDPTNDTDPVKVDFVKSARNILNILKDIYGPSTDGPPEDGGNLTDLVGDKLPPQQDPYRPKKFGGGLKDNIVCLRLTDTKITPDFSSLTLSGAATATVNIGTEFPLLDSPTEIGLKITSASISPSRIGLVGSASLYKVLHSDFNLQLHLNDSVLFETVIRLAKERKLTRREVEQLLASMSLDASDVMKAGALPLSFIKLGASSLLPMHRPLIGATDRLLPVQLASLPDSKMLILGGLAVPKGVFFDMSVPGLGVHYSKYGPTEGVSATIAGLATPNLQNLAQVKTYGYADLHYARRFSNTVDIDVGITYTYALAHDSDPPDPLQLQYLHAESQAWRPVSRDNQPPDADRSGHNFMFTIKGTFDRL